MRKSRPNNVFRAYRRAGEGLFMRWGPSARLPHLYDDEPIPKRFHVKPKEDVRCGRGRTFHDSKAIDVPRPGGPWFAPFASPAHIPPLPSRPSLTPSFLRNAAPLLQLSG